jgi:asparagine synthase (glutamine-hydrolysing)
MASRVTPSLLESVTLRRFAIDDRDMLSSYLRQVFTRFAIPHLTHYDDRNAMAFSVEGRMPFLDVNLVNLVSAVRYEALFSEGFTKRVLRESFADLLPSAVRLRRDKVGFHTPLAAWLRENIGWIRSFMTSDRIGTAAVLRHQSYRTALESLERGIAGSELEVWRGFIFHLWIDTFGISATSSAHRVA